MQKSQKCTLFSYQQAFSFVAHFQYLSFSFVAHFQYLSLSFVAGFQLLSLTFVAFPKLVFYFCCISKISLSLLLRVSKTKHWVLVFWKCNKSQRQKLETCNKTERQILEMYNKTERHILEMCNITECLLVLKGYILAFLH